MRSPTGTGRQRMWPRRRRRTTRTTWSGWPTPPVGAVPAVGRPLCAVFCLLLCAGLCGPALRWASARAWQESCSRHARVKKVVVNCPFPCANLLPGSCVDPAACFSWSAGILRPRSMLAASAPPLLVRAAEEAMRARAAEQLSAATAAMVTQGNLEAEAEAARKKAEKEAEAARLQVRVQEGLPLLLPALLGFCGPGVGIALASREPCLTCGRLLGA